MIDLLGFLSGLLGGLLDFLTGFLPASPFADVITGMGSLGQGIGWLNWFLPVGDLLAIFGLWIAAALVWAVVDFIVRKAQGVISGLIGSGVL